MIWHCSYTTSFYYSNGPNLTCCYSAMRHSSDGWLLRQRPMNSVATSKNWRQLRPSLLRTTIATIDVDIIITHHSWEFKRHTSSLNSGARLIGRSSISDSIWTGMLTLVTEKIPFDRVFQWLPRRTSTSTTRRKRCLRRRRRSDDDDDDDDSSLKEEV
jgi:hypothetical protein